VSETRRRHPRRELRAMDSASLDLVVATAHSLAKLRDEPRQLTECVAFVAQEGPQRGCTGGKVLRDLRASMRGKGWWD
jgi:hypothetical protein